MRSVSADCDPASKENDTSCKESMRIGSFTVFGKEKR